MKYFNYIRLISTYWKRLTTPLFVSESKSSLLFDLWLTSLAGASFFIFLFLFIWVFLLPFIHTSQHLFDWMFILIWKGEGLWAGWFWSWHCNRCLMVRYANHLIFLEIILIQTWDMSKDLRDRSFGSKNFTQKTRKSWHWPICHKRM